MPEHVYDRSKANDLAVRLADDAAVELKRKAPPGSVVITAVLIPTQMAVSHGYGVKWLGTDATMLAGYIAYQVAKGNSP